MSERSPSGLKAGEILGTAFLMGLGLALATFGGLASGKVGHAWAATDWSEVAHWLPFAIVFSLFGWGLLIALPFAWKAYRAERRLQAAHPRSPWLWRKDWAGGIVRHTDVVADLKGRWLFLLLFAAVVFPIGWSQLGRAQGIGSADTLLMFFGAVILAFGCDAVRRTLRWWRKRDASLLRLATLPATVGGRLTGSVELLREAPSGETYELELYCIRHERQRFGTREVGLWERSKRQVSQTDAAIRGRHSVPVDFEIPSECPPTDWEAKIVWRLYIQSPGRQTDFRASFEVPVFRPDSTADATV